MAKKLTDLTARTATADSDLLHINSGGVDYKETKGKFCNDIVQYVELSNQSSITSQVDTLAGTVKSPSFYAGKINSYGAAPAAVTGAPVANSGHLLISIYSGSYVRIEFTEVDGQRRSYEKFKQGGTWDSQWTQLPSRAEITLLNNNGLRKADHYFSGSFTTNSSGYVLLGSIPSSFDVTINDFYVIFLIRGWSGGTGALSLAVGSNGTDLYLTSTPGTTITGITVRLWYIKSVLA